jgi:CheY-like chemotaxis protein
MKSVLFVDDDSAVLRALERALRAYLSEWRMVFTLGPSAALESLEAYPFDAVVTDFGMPEMDGIELLTRVRAKTPKAFRILLSGNLAKSSQTDGVADVTLVKPCGVKTLVSCLTRHFQGLPPIVPQEDFGMEDE